MIAQLAYSEIDTLSYPRLAYPGEIVRDTCVEFTPEQAKLAAIDGINADSYKQEADSLKSVINDYQTFVNSKNAEIKQLTFDVKVRNEINAAYKAETGKYRDWWVTSENKLKLTKTVDKIVYPVLGTTVLGTVVYILVSSFLHK